MITAIILSIVWFIFGYTVGRNSAKIDHDYKTESFSLIEEYDDQDGEL